MLYRLVETTLRLGEAGEVFSGAKFKQFNFLDRPLFEAIKDVLEYNLIITIEVPGHRDRVFCYDSAVELTPLVNKLNIDDWMKLGFITAADEKRNYNISVNKKNYRLQINTF